MKMEMRAKIVSFALWAKKRKWNNLYHFVYCCIGVFSFPVNFPDLTTLKFQLLIFQKNFFASRRLSSHFQISSPFTCGSHKWRSALLSHLSTFLLCLFTFYFYFLHSLSLSTFRMTQMTRCPPPLPPAPQRLPPHPCRPTHQPKRLNPPLFHRLEQSVMWIVIVHTLTHYDFQPSSSTPRPPPVAAPTRDRQGGICGKCFSCETKKFRFSFKDQYQPPRSPGRWASFLFFFANQTISKKWFQGDIHGHLSLALPMSVDPCIHLHPLPQGEPGARAVLRQKISNYLRIPFRLHLEIHFDKLNFRRFLLTAPPAPPSPTHRALREGFRLTRQDQGKFSFCIRPIFWISDKDWYLLWSRDSSFSATWVWNSHNFPFSDLLCRNGLQVPGEIESKNPFYFEERKICIFVLIWKLYLCPKWNIK